MTLPYTIPGFGTPAAVGLPSQYLADEAAGKTPLEGYLFSYAGQEYAYTPNDRDVTMGGIIFVSDPVLRDAIRQSEDFSGEEMVIRLDARSQIALVWQTADYGIPVYFRVYRSFVNATSPDPFIVWEGEIRDVNYKDGVAVFTAQDIRQNVNRPVPRYTHQALCNHQLYGPRCLVNRAAFETDWTIVFQGALPGTIPALSYMEADGATTPAPAYYTGGVITWLDLATGITHRRFIRAHINTIPNRIRLYPFTIFPGSGGGPQFGEIIKVVPGCDRRYQTCRDKFANTPNFGGFPFGKERDPANGVK